MQHLGSAAAASTSQSHPEVDMPVDEIIDVGAPWATAAAAAASPVVDQAGGAALEAKMDHDMSPAFEMDIGDGSLEDIIAGGVDEFLDVFRALDGPDGDGGGFADMPGLSAGDQGMEVDGDEFAWLNSPDAFMPLPITEDGLGQVAATAIPTGEEEEEARMAPGDGDDTMEEDIGGGSLVAGFSLAVPEATTETAPAAAAAVAATTTLPPVALECDTAEGSGGSGISGDCEYVVSPHAPAYDFCAAGGGAGVAGYLLAGGPADGVSAVVGAVGVGVAAEAVALTVSPTATNMIIANGGVGSGSIGCAGAGGGGGGHDGGLLSQKDVTRRQKVERYLAKKKRRRWSKASSYQSRQRVANSRPRHKGRFLPLVSDFVPISELKRRQRALLAQQAQKEEEEDKQAPLPPLAAPGWGASAQFLPDGDYGHGQG